MILVFGSLNMDLIVPVPHLPRPGETVLSPAHATAPGGKGANQAVAAARAGADVVMVGCVGRDAFGDQLLGGEQRGRPNLFGRQTMGKRGQLAAHSTEVSTLEILGFLRVTEF